jgi:predicted alpha-1,2-mannosidase
LLYTESGAGVERFDIVESMVRYFAPAPALACLLAACTTPGSDGSTDDEVGTTGESEDDTESASDTDDTGDTTTEGDTDYPWPEEDLAAFINPMIGTGGVGYTVGTMNPGASMPFGMVKPGPDTGIGPIQINFLNCTGYHYDQSHLWGFSHSRINGMGVPDYGAILVTPTVGMDASKATNGGVRSLYDHETEEVGAAYYAVTLDDPGVRAELTANTWAARHRYTWDEPSSDATLVINLGYGPAQAPSTASEVTIDPATGTIRGMMTVNGSYSDRFGGLPTYFAARLSQPIAEHGVWDDMGTLAAGTASMTGAEIGAWLRFDLAAADEPVVELDLAISYVSIEEAEQNLATLGDEPFHATRAAAAEAWQTEVERVRVLGGTPEQRTMLYSALYRAFLAPTIFTDSSGAYRGFDEQPHQADGFIYYSDFSLWDTYRTLHPLLNLIQRDRSADMMHSLALMAAQGGDLPKWPLGIGYTGGMVGTSADIVLADAYLKDITDFDYETAYAAAYLHATEPRMNDGRPGILGYREQGWVASEESGSSASETLEFAHADYALARWAEALGFTQDAAMFDEGAGSWANLWEPSLEFLIGRRADGSFEVDGFDPLVWADYYAEGTAHHYTWAVPHDAAGLAEIMGGDAAMAQRLGEYFETSQDFLEGAQYNPLEPVPYYWQSNEPSLHVPYLFTDVGDPASTQRWVAWIRERHYGLGPDGLPGNDDAGTMSAWYVFSAIGLYPLPGGDGYWITAPTFERIELDLGDEATPERSLTILAEGAGIYVAGASWNGEALERPWISWQQMREGGTLRVMLAEDPTSFGTW